MTRQTEWDNDTDFHEPALWCSVIQQSIDDYYAECPSWRQGARDWEAAMREAKLFLLKTGGVWARAREDVCEAAGVDPEALRNFILDGGYKNDDDHGDGERASLG